MEVVVQAGSDVDLEDLQGKEEVLQQLEVEEEQLEGQRRDGGREGRDQEEEEEQRRLEDLLETDQLLQQLQLLLWNHRKLSAVQVGLDMTGC